MVKWFKKAMLITGIGICAIGSLPAQAQAKAQTAPAGHSKDDIKAKYAELISYCKENGYDITDVAKEFGLNAKSTYEEFDTALKRLIYTTAKKEHKEKDATEGMMEV